MASQYATPFKGETQDDKKLRMIKGMRFLTKLNPKKYMMARTKDGYTVLKELVDVIHWRWSPPSYIYQTVESIHTQRRNRK